MKPILLAILATAATGCMDSAVSSDDLQNDEIDGSAVDAFDASLGQQQKQMKDITTNVQGVKAHGFESRQSTGASGDIDAVSGTELRNHQSGYAGTVDGVTVKGFGKHSSGYDTTSVDSTGLGSNQAQNVPTNVDWVKVTDLDNRSSGYASTEANGGRLCVVKSDRSAWCWGYNGDGGLGIGTLGGSHTQPAQVTGLDNVAGVALSNNASCAIQSNGAVWCWGSNRHGELGQGTVDAVDISGHAVPMSVLGLPEAVAIAAGTNYFCALTAHKGAYCWGSFSSTPVATVITNFQGATHLQYKRGNDIVQAVVAQLKP